MKIKCVSFTACMLLMVPAMPAQESPDTNAAPVPIHCQVFSTAGKPVAGAKVYLDCPASRGVFLDDSTVAQGATDTEGSFRTSFTPPAHWKRFSAVVVVDGGKDGIGVGHVFHHPPFLSPEKYPVSLLPAAELKATILTPEGKPAAGLELWVDYLALPKKEGDLPMRAFFTQASRLPGNLWRARTDAQGKLRIPQLPEGASIYLKHGDSRWAQFRGRHNILVGPLLKVDGTEPTLQLAEPGVIRGRILLPDGKPASGSIVSILDDSRPYVTAHGDEVKANDNGEFVVPSVPPATYKLFYDTQPPHFDRWIGAEKKDVVVSAGKTTELGDLVVAEAAYVTGEVLDAESGKVIEESLVFRLAPGKHSLYYRSSRYPKDGYHPPDQKDAVPVEIKGGERKTIAFKLRPVKAEDRVMGVVVDEQGKPAENARVVMAGYGGNPFPVTMITDKTGEFKFTRTRDSSQEAVLAYKDQAMSEVVLADSGKTITLQLREKGWGRVVGTVVDDAGNPVVDAEIGWNMLEPVAAWGPLPKTVKSDAGGRFEFPRFWSREKGIIFFCKAAGLGNGALRNQSVRDGATTELKFILRQANTFVAGMLVDSTGKPVEGISVYASGDAQPGGAKGRTDAEGRFRIEGLSKGRVYLRATLEKEGSTSEISRWVNAGDAGLKLAFPAADGEVSGIVVDAKGNPAPLAKVASIERDRSTTADKDGRFKLSGVVRGWFTVEAGAPNAQGEWVEKKLRLKTGMKDAKITLPATKEEAYSRPVNPVNLIGKPAAEVKIATWVNCDPLPPHGKGKVRILDFWGIQCAPCIATFPKVQKFWEAHQDKGIELVAVTGFYPEQEVKEFLAKHPTYNFPVALEPENSTSSQDYDVRGIPTYVVIDAFGKIVSKGHDFEEAGKVALGLVQAKVN